MPGERFINGLTTDTSPEDLPSPGEGCTDFKGRFILPDHHYIPGPDSCTVCLCDGGKPKWCQAVLCAPPHECKSFRIGNSCCEFICLDNTVQSKDGVAWGKGWAGGDSGLWMMTTVVTVVLALALLVFLICRLRHRRLSRARGNSAIAGSAASLGTFEAINSTSHLSRQPNLPGFEHESGVHVNGLYLWKPPAPSYAEAAQDAPPPYSEAPPTQAAAMEESELQESTGLLSTLPQILIQPEPFMILSSTDTLNSEFLSRGTPPPSYSEVMAENAVDDTAAGNYGGEAAGSVSSNRMSCVLPMGEETSISTHRLSLQLPLDSVQFQSSQI